MSGSTPLILQVENLRPGQRRSLPQPQQELGWRAQAFTFSGLDFTTAYCSVPSPQPVSAGEGEKGCPFPAGLLPTVSLHPPLTQWLPLTSVGGGGLELVGKAGPVGGAVGSELVVG